MSAQLVLGEHNHLATPRSLAEKTLAGQEPTAELHVAVPHGKSTRVVTVDLTEHDLLLLIEKSAEALRALAEYSS